MIENLDSTLVLVRRAQEGDREARDALFWRYLKTAVKAAERALGPSLRRREDPEDLALSGIREAVRDFSRFDYRGEDSFRLWICRIVENKARDRAEYWNAGKREASRERPIDGLRESRSEIGIPSRDASVTQYVVVGEREELMRRAIESLSRRYREVIRYAHYEGISHKEIAARMRLPSEDAARMLLRRAEEAVRLRLPPGIDSDW